MFCSLVMAFFIIQTGTAQKTVDKGYLKMEITDVRFGQEEANQIAGAMKGSLQEIYFTPEKQKIVVDMMGGMVKMQTYQDFKSDKYENYMDMMGQKIKMILGKEELLEKNEKMEMLSKGTKVTYDKNDTKTIIGYKCHKAVVTIPTGEGMDFDLVMYVTDKIKVPQLSVQDLDYIKLDGTPLELIMDMGMMAMTYTAVLFTEDFSMDVFNKPEGDYKEMSMEDLQNMGMGNMFGPR
jgi:hypothetical protein